MKITVCLLLALVAACHAMPQYPSAYDPQQTEVQPEEGDRAKRGLPIFHAPIASLPLPVYHAPIVAPAPILTSRIIAAHAPIIHAPLIHHPPLITFHR